MAATVGLASAVADAAIDEVLARLTEALAGIALPNGLKIPPAGLSALTRMIEVGRERVGKFA